MEKAISLTHRESKLIKKVNLTTCIPTLKNINLKGYNRLVIEGCVVKCNGVNTNPFLSLNSLPIQGLGINVIHFNNIKLEPSCSLLKRFKRLKRVYFTKCVINPNDLKELESNGVEVYEDASFEQTVPRNHRIAKYYMHDYKSALSVNYNTIYQDGTCVITPTGRQHRVSKVYNTYVPSTKGKHKPSVEILEALRRAYISGLYRHEEDIINLTVKDVSCTDTPLKFERFTNLENLAVIDSVKSVYCIKLPTTLRRLEIIRTRHFKLDVLAQLPRLNTLVLDKDAYSKNSTAVKKLRKREIDVEVATT